MIARLAAALVLLSQGLVLWVVLAPSGRSATAFTFAGHAALGLGIALGLWVHARRRAHTGPPGSQSS